MFISYSVGYFCLNLAFRSSMDLSASIPPEYIIYEFYIKQMNWPYNLFLIILIILIIFSPKNYEFPPSQLLSLSGRPEKLWNGSCFVTFHLCSQPSWMLICIAAWWTGWTYWPGLVSMLALTRSIWTMMKKACSSRRHSNKSMLAKLVRWSIANI